MIFGECARFSIIYVSWRMVDDLPSHTHATLCGYLADDAQTPGSTSVMWRRTSPLAWEKGPQGAQNFCGILAAVAPLLGKAPRFKPSPDAASTDVSLITFPVTASQGGIEGDHGSTGQMRSPKARNADASVGNTESRLHAHAADDGMLWSGWMSGNTSLCRRGPLRHTLAARRQGP
jgi:hypothetical protein